MPPERPWNPRHDRPLTEGEQRLIRGLLLFALAALLIGFAVNAGIGVHLP